MRRLLCWTGCLLFLIILFFSGTAALFWKLGLFAPLNLAQLTNEQETSIIYDERQEKIREYCTYCREITRLEEMGDIPLLAVAVEDKRFWTRSIAIDPWGMIRAAWNDMKKMRAEQGGSTISQQTAQILFLEDDLARERAEPTQKWRKWERKIKQIWFAVKLEGRIDRRQILELYLNSAFLGHGKFGVKTASTYYFGKELKDLDSAEKALLVGLLRTPSSSPFIGREKAKALRARVLEQFVNEGIISDEERKIFAEYPLPEKQETDQCNAFHAAEFARLQILEIMRFADRGVKAYLTINCEWQRTATSALNESVRAMQTRNPALTDLRGVAIAVDRRNGTIKIFAQVPAFAEYQYRADQIQRHAGSAAKPFAVLAYLMTGGRLSCKDEGEGACKLNDSGNLTIFINPQVGLKHIQNFPYEGLPRYVGYADPILCLAESRNACIMSMVRGVNGGLGLVGKDDITELIVRLGVRLPEVTPELSQKVAILSNDLAGRLDTSRLFLDPGKTVAIGSIDISPYEMVRAWTGFFNGFVDLRILNQIITKDGNAPSFPDQEPKRILEELWVAHIKEILTKSEYIALRKEFPEKNHRDLLQMARERGETNVQNDKERLKLEAQREAEKISLALIRGLRATVEFEHGTGKLARIGDEKLAIPKLDFPICGKTGTATDQKGETTDNWFIGCTPSYIMAVWIGRDQKLPMKTIDANGKEIQETGGRNALPVFIKTVAKIFETYPKETFPEETNPKAPFKFSVSPKTVSPQENETLPENNKDDF